MIKSQPKLSTEKLCFETNHSRLDFQLGWNKDRNLGPGSSSSTNEELSQLIGSTFYVLTKIGVPNYRLHVKSEAYQWASQIANCFMSGKPSDVCVELLCNRNPRDK